MSVETKPGFEALSTPTTNSPVNADEIRQYVLSQADRWSQLPYLALHRAIHHEYSRLEINAKLCKEIDKLKHSATGLSKKGKQRLYRAAETEQLPYSFNIEEFQLYKYGLFRLRGSSVNVSGTYVDCGSGKLLHLVGKPDLTRTAPDDQIVSLLPEGYIPAVVDSDEVKVKVFKGTCFDANIALGNYLRSRPEVPESFSEPQIMHTLFVEANKLGVAPYYVRTNEAS